MLDIKVSGWDTVSESGEIVPSGHRIGQAELLFEKIEDAAVEAQLKKLNDAKLANIAAQKAAQPQKDAVSYDDFDKMDIRVGVVTEAEKVPKAKKLLRLNDRYRIGQTHGRFRHCGEFFSGAGSGTPRVSAGKSRSQRDKRNNVQWYDTYDGISGRASGIRISCRGCACRLEDKLTKRFYG